MSFSFSVSPSNESSRLIFFRIDWFNLLTVKETLKSLLQHQHIYVHAYIYLWMHIYISVCECVCVYIYIYTYIHVYMGFPGGSNGRESACNAGDLCSILGQGRSPGEGSSDGKEYACNAGDLGSILGQGRSPGEGSGTHSSLLAWRIPWTEGPGGLQSLRSQRAGHG